jgi:serine/threonine protein kinase
LRSRDARAMNHVYLYGNKIFGVIEKQQNGVYSMIRRCLNPRTPHKNASMPLPVLSAADMAGAATLPMSEAQVENKDEDAESTAEAIEGEQVTCQFCKYLLEDARLGDCRVTRWIGSGTFGDVYEAEQAPPLSRKVAIKVMSVEHVADGEGAQLFEREARMIAALDHPHILPVLRVGSIAEGRPYLVMKFAAHGSLQKFCQPTMPPLSAFATALTPPTASEIAEQSTISQPDDEMQTLYDVADTPSPDEDVEASMATQPLVEDEPETAAPADEQEDKPAPADIVQTVPSTPNEYVPLTPQQLLPYLEAAAEALQYAHEHNIVHLDVKPANLLLDSNDRLLLADFSVSALLEDYTHASLHGYVGTPLYTAPEQWLEQPRPASDQYALAVTCYQLLAGRPPFNGNLYSIMHGHIQVQPPSPRQFQPLIPVEVETVILRALAKNPADRYPDMRSFAQAYREALELSASSPTEAHDQRSITSALTGQLDDPERATIAAEETIALPSGRNGRDEHKQENGRDKSAPTAGKDEHSLPIVGEKIQPRRRNRLAIMGIILLIILLIGGTLGTLRVETPCLFGYCAAMQLGASNIVLTNGVSQRVAVRDTGIATLNWQATRANPSATWLTFAPSQGSVQPGQTGYLTITSNSSGLSDGTYSSDVTLAAPGVAAQTISVEMLVKTGLNAVSVQGNISNFTYAQGALQPASQQITITNKSGQTLSWLVTYSENTWLIVTPNMGALANGKSVTLQVTANAQNLTPNTYLAQLVISGKLAKQRAVSALQQYDITLMVMQSAPTATPVTPSPTAPSFQFPSFTAQPALVNGAPTTLRSGHSMVWDDHDDLLLVFGGIDNNRTLLNDLWAYSPASGNWSELSPQTSTTGCNGSVPAPRENAAMVWDSVDQQILLYGGTDGSGHYFGDLWSFSPASKAWTLLKCSGNGPGARATSAVWDGHEMLLVDGINKFGMQSDFWSYTPGASGGWQRLSNPPMSPRTYDTLVWDSTDSRLYLFGGLGANGVQLDDFWSYTTSAGWTQITPNSASNPLGRQQAMGAWDSRDNLLILSGGFEDGQGVPFWGFWMYDPKQNAWGLEALNMSGTNAPHVPGRTAAAMVWDNVDGRIYLYAGAGNGKTGSSLNDLWMIYS